MQFRDARRRHFNGGHGSGHCYRCATGKQHHLTYLGNSEWLQPNINAALWLKMQVAGEQEDDECTNQLMVVNADGDLTGDQVMVVEDAESLEALSVLTQGDNTHHYIVYVQEHTVEIN